MSQLLCFNNSPAINAEKFRKVFTSKKSNNCPEEDLKNSKQEDQQRMKSIMLRYALNNLKMLQDL
jgi:hypothetical protein